MTRDDIIRMAREADREWDGDRYMIEWLTEFANLVAKAVRERITKSDGEETFIEMAKGFPCIFNHIDDYAHWTWEEAAEFAVLVAAAERDKLWNLAFQHAELAVATEREECAKICDEVANDAAKNQYFHALDALEDAAAAIRERGNND
jgi:hypothetical protein